MIFIKNKMRFVFWAILMSLGFSITLGITNVCAMRDEEIDETQDPETAASMTGATVEPPRTSKKSTRELPSAKKVVEQVKNYCRNVIEALNEDECNVTEDQKLINARNLLMNFYRKIPSVLKDSTRQRGSMSVEHHKELQKKDIFKYHVSLFLCLGMCIANACNEDISVELKKEFKGLKGSKDVEKQKIKEHFYLQCLRIKDEMRIHTQQELS